MNIMGWVFDVQEDEVLLDVNVSVGFGGNLWWNS